MTRFRRSLWIPAALAVLVIAAPLAGCALGSAPEETVFRLEAPAVEPPVPPNGQVEVLTPRVAGSLAGAVGLAVAYEGEVVRVDEIAGGRWEDPPAEVLETALRDAFLPILEDVTDSGPRWRLSWSLDRLEAVVPPEGTEPAEVRAALTWTLRRDRARDDHAAGAIRESLPVTAGAPLPEVVLTFNKVVRRALGRLVAEVSAATRGP